jgi:hypothetical protein
MVAKSKIDKLDPSLAIPNTESEEPNRMYDFKDRLLANWTKSNTDMLLPSFAKP